MCSGGVKAGLSLMSLEVLSIMHKTGSDVALCVWPLWTISFTANLRDYLNATTNATTHATITRDY